MDERHLADLQQRVDSDRDSINKHEIARTPVAGFNEEGDSGLRGRREIIRRIVEWEELFDLLAGGCVQGSKSGSQGSPARQREGLVRAQVAGVRP